MKQKAKLAIILGAEFIAIAVVLLLIFFSTKKQYTITFDLDGGTLISGTWNNSGASFTSVTEPLCRNENGVLTVTEGSSSSWVASGGAEEYFASCQAQYLSQVRENRRVLEQWQSLGGENLYSEVYYTSNGVESSDERTFSAETE